MSWVQQNYLVILGFVVSDHFKMRFHRAIIHVHPNQLDSIRKKLQVTFLQFVISVEPDRRLQNIWICPTSWCTNHCRAYTCISIKEVLFPWMPNLLNEYWVTQTVGCFNVESCTRSISVMLPWQLSRKTLEKRGCEHVFACLSQRVLITRPHITIML